MSPEKLLEEFISRNDHIDRDKAKRIVNEKFLALFAPHILEYCANYEVIQDKLLILTNTQLNILSKIIKHAELHNQDWLLPAGEFITLIENPNYKELVESLEGKLITENELNHLMYLTRNYANYYDIKDYSELGNIKAIRDRKLEETKDCKSPEIILLNKYGISFNTAYEILKRFGKDLELLPESQEKRFLTDISNIMSNKGTEKPVCDDIEFINHLNSRLNNLYTSLYNEELYQLNEKNFIQYIQAEEGIMIPIYDAGTEFTMSIHSVGLASEKRPENYYESWNRANARDSHFCNSILTSRSLRTSIKNCAFGFASYEPNDLKLLAANDLGTGGLKDDPLAAKIGHDEKLIADVVYHVPSQIDKNTRISNNEVYRSRRRVVDGKLEKINPDYLIYMKETYGTEQQNDPIWHETVKASIDYYKATGEVLPIVIIDCEKCLSYNVQKLDEMTANFITNYDDKRIITDIVELIHTLRMGYATTGEHIINKYLGKEKCLEILNNLLQVIVQMSEFVPRLSLEHLDTLTSSIDEEYVKMNASSYWIEQFSGKKEIEKDITIYSVIEETKRKIQESLLSKGYKIDNNGKPLK